MKLGWVSIWRNIGDLQGWEGANMIIFNYYMYEILKTENNLKMKSED